jgi:hypothetical protein
MEFDGRPLSEVTARIGRLNEFLVPIEGERNIAPQFRAGRPPELATTRAPRWVRWSAFTTVTGRFGCWWSLVFPRTSRWT